MSSIAELETFEYESARFDSLMAFKIQNILLVSSLYDIYNLREDGQLTDQLVAEYAEFSKITREMGLRAALDHANARYEGLD